MEPSRELPKLVEGTRELVPGSCQQLGGLGGIVRQPRLGQPQLQGERRKPLLRPVVEVPLEAAACGVGRGHDPAP